MWNNIELVKKYIKESSCKGDVLYKMKLKHYGGNYNTLDRFIMINKIDVSHFNSGNSIKNKENIKRLISRNLLQKVPLCDILVENSTYSSSNHLKERLYKEGLKERKCEKCGQSEIWHGERMSLILDHINGKRRDCRLKNLRIVCPNCNATLPTHCRGYDTIENKEKRKCLKCGKTLSRNSKKYCSTICATEARKKNIDL